MERTTKEGVNLSRYLADVAMRLDEAPHGERGAIVDSAAAFLGWSRQAVYYQLKRRAGWSSGRKTRTDKGTTTQPIDTAEMIGSMQRQSVRKNGKQVLHLPTAMAIAATNGHEIAVSRGRMGKLMRDRRLDARSQATPRPVQSMRSTHPNHVHQVDPSLCLIYYLNGRQFIIRDDQWYKNKPEGDAKILAKVWRYVLYDHASATIVPWYVEARGESAANLFEFLVFAWSRQPARPFHGAPDILLLDPGSANTAHTTKNFIAALGTKLIAHKPGAARVKGGVECAQNIVETKFESRLRFEPVDDVEQLNAAAAAWANAFNANLIPHEDTRLRRKGMQPVARYDLWLTIRAEQLRVLPDREQCKLFLEGKSATRKVSPSLEISYKHPLADGACLYDLRGLDGICAGDKVEVSPLALGDREIYVRTQRYDGDTIEYRLTPIVFDPVYGFRADAPVWGKDMRAQPDTEIERQGKALDRRAFPDRTLDEIEHAKEKNDTPFDGRIVAHSHLHDVSVPPSLAARRGSEIALPDRARPPEEERYSGIGARIQLRRVLNRAPTEYELAAFDRWLGLNSQGVTQTQIEAWLTRDDEERDVAER